jgi:hypothetical protein
VQQHRGDAAVATTRSQLNANGKMSSPQQQQQQESTRHPADGSGSESEDTRMQSCRAHGSKRADERDGAVTSGWNAISLGPWDLGPH